MFQSQTQLRLSIRLLGSLWNGLRSMTTMTTIPRCLSLWKLHGRKNVLTRITISHQNSSKCSWERATTPIFATCPNKFKSWTGLRFFIVVTNCESISSVPSNQYILYVQVAGGAWYLIVLISFRDQFAINPKFKIGVSKRNFLELLSDFDLKDTDMTPYLWNNYFRVLRNDEHFSYLYFSYLGFFVYLFHSILSYSIQIS